MASNEIPFGPSPLAVEAMKAATGDVNFYPDNGVMEADGRGWPRSTRSTPRKS